MKRLLALFAALVGFALASAPAFAWDIKQTGDGNAYWVAPSGTAVHVGETVLNVYMPDVSAASTVHVVSPVKGKVKAVYGVLSGAMTGTITYVDTWIQSTVTANLYTEVTRATSKASFAANGSAVTSSTLSFVPTASNSVTKGGVIAIHSDGGGSGFGTSTAPTTFTVVIYPE